MLRAERRKTGDRVAAALLVVAFSAAIAVVAFVSPAAHTTSVTTTGPVPAIPDAPADVPSTVSELWRAPSAATPSPVAVGPVVVTAGPDPEAVPGADATTGTVVGREPLSGNPRWSYQRDLPLCTVGSGWDTAIAVFQRAGYCSEVSALTASTGARGPQRNSDVHPEARLSAVGDLVTATGPGYLEVWRSDLVKTLMYGATRTDAQPDRQPRRLCRHASTVGVDGRLAVLERCPGEPTDRLTVLRPDGEEPDRPEFEFSVPLPTAGARLVAISSDRVAVLLPNPGRLSIRDGAGAEVASHPLDLPASDLAGDAPRGVAPTTVTTSALLWWSGSRTVALDTTELVPRWAIPNTLGAGTSWAGRLVVPVAAGLAVLNADSGALLRTVPVDRPGWTGPVSLGTLGPVLLEQRGPTVVALH